MSTRINMKSIVSLYLLLLIASHVIARGGGRGGGGRGGGRGSSHGGGSRGGWSSGRWSSGGWGSWFGGSSKSSSSLHTYPKSTGLSGDSYSKKSQSHSYPKSNSGYSGSGSRTIGSRGKTDSSTGYPYHTNSYNNYLADQRPFHHTPYYYSAPQYVYVNEYRHSNSRFGDILTGLALYNLGRTMGSHNEHIYYDDYYRRRYESPGSSYRPDKPQIEASCRLKIKQNYDIKILKVPCEIVTTLTEDSKMVPVNTVNTTVCVSNVTVQITPNTITNSTTSISGTVTSNITNSVNNTNAIDVNRLNDTRSEVNETLTTVSDSTDLPKVVYLNVTSLNKSGNNENNTNTTVTVTSCNTTVTNPLQEKGPKVNAADMECIVEIQTKEFLMQHAVSCKTLIEYAKMPEPKKETSMIVPSKGVLQSWLKSPPWWLSIFIAV